MSLMLMTMSWSVNAQSARPPTGTVDTATFDQILEPVWKVYSFVKYTATAIAILFLLFAGIQFIMSGNDVMKRENAKHMISYVFVGLIVVWAAPFVVQLFTF